MEMIRNIAMLVLFIGGGFFFISGTVGLIRMPDPFCKLHATTKCDTLGAGMILAGMVVYQGFSVNSIKLILVIAFIWITNSTGAHIIGKSTYLKDKIDKEKMTISYKE